MTYLLQIFCHEVIETKKKGKEENIDMYIS